MAAAQFDIILYEGSTSGRVIGYENSDGTAIVFVDVQMQVRPSKNSSTVLLELRDGNGFAVDSDAGTITFDDAYLRDLIFSPAVYDLSSSTRLASRSASSRDASR